MDGVDLNGWQAQCLRNFLRRRPHVHRQDVVRAADGFCAVDEVREDRGAVQRRSSGANAVLRRTIPSHGVCSTDLSGEPARYRNLPVGPGVETLSPGFPRTGAALDAGRCQRDARLAHSCRARPTSDRPSQQAVRRRKPGFAPDDTVYALDSATIDRLSVFPWAHFRSTKAAVKMHTLLDLRGNIPSFIHVSDGKLHDVHALDLLLPEAGAIYVMDRGYVDFVRLHRLHLAGAFFVTRAKSNMEPIGSIPPRATVPLGSSAIRPSLSMGTIPAGITPNICGAFASGTSSRARRWCSSPTSLACRLRPSARSTKADGRSSCSSSGSSSICGSNGSSGHPKTR